MRDAVTMGCLLGLLALGCDDGEASGATDAGPSGPADAGPGAADAGAALPSTVGTEERPATFVVPNAHDGSTALPLLVLLHGYSASGSAQDVYLGVSNATRAAGFYLVIPDGTTDASGNRFWNATEACCDFGNTGVDDVGYLIGLVDEVEALVPVRDVYFFGHSNGGFMSYRMACEHPDRVSAIGSLAGSDFATPCDPAQPVSVLQVHGTDDGTIEYDGVAMGYPSAPDAVARWAGYAGCEDTVTMGEPLDLDTSVDGAETTVERRETGCSGAEAELWSIVGGSHIPPVRTRDGFAARLLEWLDDHGR